ncbi:Uncharacterised protein [Mycobacteroides abscessus subsp. abscessus]|nr:Uncharacterised protein [Mycobacteroides abscessus subsp. abscessus]SHW32801.1 Uncharacterised protein [Mycobacteroides abscessus subsp. abscessus]SHW39507.1 Uncharacterised protein [Mycobacteroides abscessus subsp. abscessus]SHW67551.1 Uncharacterised protein [Mycobacteroides abscessus subsp. abscessus]SHX16945.1 Uncharacterised protein [Mycobacteroides abscessus subsp. abscessus]
MNPFRKESFWNLASIELVTVSGRPDLRRYSRPYRGMLGPVQPSVHVTRQVEHYTPAVVPVNRVLLGAWTLAIALAGLTLGRLAMRERAGAAT